MEERHEIIQFDSLNPIKLFMHKLGDVSRHWHDSIEILFVLAGSVDVYYGDSGAVLSKDDILLINSNTIHELHSADCVLIAVQIKLAKFGLDQKLTQNLFFDCNSSETEDNEQFLHLKQIIASLLQAGTDKSDIAIFRNRSLAFSLMSELVRKFRIEKPSYDQSTAKYLERLTSIISYIHEHYDEQLTLTDLADVAHLSVPYLSSFFEKYMGMNFSTYYTNYRIEKATQQLIRSDESIEVIARSNGFTDPRSFTRAFRKKYAMLPSEYRKKAPIPFKGIKKDPLLAINYLDFKPENYFQLLSSYLPAQLPNDAVISTSAVNFAQTHISTDEIDIRKTKTTLLKHNWKNILCVGKAKDLLQAEVQEMVRRTQEEIGFRFVRFHGIFSDDMMVCKRKENGNLTFSFVLIDKVIDFLLSVSLKPLVQFSFMPEALAKEPEKKVYDSAFIISPPSDMKEWTLLIHQFLQHCAFRYGMEEVGSWLFTIWNEPDTSEALFGFQDSFTFFRFYEASWKTVKQFDSSLKVGTPSLFLMDDSCFQWTNDFFNYVEKNSCLPDFTDCHYYSNDFSDFQVEKDAFLTQPVSDDPDYFQHYLKTVRHFLADRPAADRSLYITEWNFTTSHRNLLNDTCFKGCYVAKNYLENYDKTEGIGYWSLTDLIEESQPEEELFHGGMGLFTQNGIPKPPYLVMRMMASLGDELISRGNGYFITRNNPNEIQLLLYNYEHCSQLLAEESFGLTTTNRDGVFPKKEQLNIAIPLQGLEKGTWMISESILNRESGSCFDLWVRMGSPAITKKEATYLKRLSEPDLHVYRQNLTEGKFTYQAKLLPQEVRLVEMKKLTV